MPVNSPLTWNLDPLNPSNVKLGLSVVPYVKTAEGTDAILSLDNGQSIVSTIGGKIKLQHTAERDVRGAI